MKAKNVTGAGPRRLTRQPGEQRQVGRRKTVPDLLDLLLRHAAPLRQSLFGEARGDADAERARHQFQQRPTPGPIERIEPAGQTPPRLRLGHGAHGFDDLRQPRRLRRFAGLPHQRDGFGEIADEVVGQAKQHWIGALLDQSAQQPRLDLVQHQVAAQSGQRIAPVGVGRDDEIIDQQRQLAVARRLVEQVFEQLRKSPHSASSPS